MTGALVSHQALVPFPLPATHSCFIDAFIQKALKEWTNCQTVCQVLGLWVGTIGFKELSLVERLEREELGKGAISSVVSVKR